MNTFIKLCFIFSGIVLAFTLFIIISRKIISNKLVKNLMAENYEEFDKLINNDLTKLVIKPYNLFFMQLNKEMISKNNSAVQKTANVFSRIKMNKDQAVTLYMRLFHYYLDQDDKTHAKRYYKKLNDYEFKGKEGYKVIYDTLVEDGYKYLNETLKAYESTTDESRKLEFEIMLMNMYTNKGDLKEAKKYEKLSSERAKTLTK